MHIDFDIENNDKDPKFEVGDQNIRKFLQSVTLWIDQKGFYC